MLLRFLRKRTAERFGDSKLQRHEAFHASTFVVVRRSSHWSFSRLGYDKSIHHSSIERIGICLPVQTWQRYYRSRGISQTVSKACQELFRWETTKTGSHHYILKQEGGGVPLGAAWTGSRLHTILSTKEEWTTGFRGDSIPIWFPSNLPTSGQVSCHVSCQLRKFYLARRQGEVEPGANGGDDHRPFCLGHFLGVREPKHARQQVETLDKLFLSLVLLPAAVSNGAKALSKHPHQANRDETSSYLLVPSLPSSASSRSASIHLHAAHGTGVAIEGHDKPACHEVTWGPYRRRPS